MSEENLTTIFGRIGSKTRLKEDIYKLFPKDFKTYVEPFVGGGAVMLGYSFKPHQKIVINDLDKTLISQWKKLKKGVSGDIEQYNTNDLSKLQRLRDSPNGNELSTLVSYIINSSNTFGSTGKGRVYTNTNPISKLKKLHLYKDKLKTATIYSMSYEKVIDKYNLRDSFFYLDPPYENSKILYMHSGMDFEKLAKTLRGIKGKFLLSINDSKYVRNLFKDFKIIKLNVGGYNSNDNYIGHKDRRELFIKNF